MENLKEIIELVKQGEIVDLVTEDSMGHLEKNHKSEWVLWWNGKIIKMVKSEKSMLNKLISLQIKWGTIEISEEEW